MYHSSYGPLLDENQNPIKVSAVIDGASVDGVLAVDLFRDNSLVFISNDDLVRLRENGRLKP